MTTQIKNSQTQSSSPVSARHSKPTTHIFSGWRKHVLSRAFISLVAAGILALGSLSPAHADFIMTLDDLGFGTGPEFVILDNSPADSDPTVGVIAFLSALSGSVGLFDIQINTGISKPFLGFSSDRAVLKLSDTTVTTGVGGTLEIRLTDTDFVYSTPLTTTGLASEVGGVMLVAGDGYWVST